MLYLLNKRLEGEFPILFWEATLFFYSASWAFYEAVGSVCFMFNWSRYLMIRSSSSVVVSANSGIEPSIEVSFLLIGESLNSEIPSLEIITLINLEWVVDQVLDK